jgi:hypothetical protein
MRCVTYAASGGDRVAVLAGESAHALPATARLIEAFRAGTEVVANV